VTPASLVGVSRPGLIKDWGFFVGAMNVLGWATPLDLQPAEQASLAVAAVAVVTVAGYAMERLADQLDGADDIAMDAPTEGPRG